MVKVLSAISRDSPSSPVSSSVGNAFSFAGTPTLSGSGGVQRYDFRWEVNPGSGYVPISGSTGLTTAGTNPLVNTNSQTQNAITVTCAQAGSYTIRMAGAPTSGGSYTVFSPTQTVSVTLAAISGSMAATDSGSDTASASGDVIVSGSLGATESGADTFAGSGSLEADEVTGSLAATESGSDIAAMSGGLAASGSLNATDAGGDTASASGAVNVSGSLAASDAGADTFSGSGSVEVEGIAGTLAATESGSDGAAGSGLVAVTGTAAGSESGADTFAGSGLVESDGISGTLNTTESGTDTASFSGMALLQGLLASAESGADLALFDGEVSVSGSLEGRDSGEDDFNGSGWPQADITGTLAVAEIERDSISAALLVLVGGSFTITEVGEDVFSASNVETPPPPAIRRTMLSCRADRRSSIPRRVR